MSITTEEEYQAVLDWIDELSQDVPDLGHKELKHLAELRREADQWEDEHPPWEEVRNGKSD